MPSFDPAAPVVLPPPDGVAVDAAVAAADPALPPLLVVRAGRDHPDLNRAVDAFVGEHLAG